MRSGCDFWLFSRKVFCTAKEWSSDVPRTSSFFLERVYILYFGNTKSWRCMSSLNNFLEAFSYHRCQIFFPEKNGHFSKNSSKIFRSLIEQNKQKFLFFLYSLSKNNDLLKTKILSLYIDITFIDFL